MNNNFYNGKLTLILPEKTKLDLPSYVDLYIGSMEECCVNIKRYELDNDEFYNGHIILNEFLIFDIINFEQILNIDIESNILFTRKIHHSGHNQKCNLDETLMFCNSFVLSIVANSSRTNNNIYGDCISHRIQLKTFNNENSNLLKRSIT
jgi:hypothetical protein